MKVRSVGYVGLFASDVDEWRHFAEHILGAQIRPESNSDRLLVKTDDYRSRIFVERAEEPGFAYLGLELGSAGELTAAVAELRDAGTEVIEGTDAERESRGVGGLAVISDPSGNRIELFVRPALDYNFTSPYSTRFVTGSDGELGFGHAVLVCEVESYEATREFYTNTLGFAVSEYTSFGPLEVTFMHCNARHHSVALARAGVSACHHIMLEVETLDMVGRALDRVEAAEIPITSSLGRHRNDQMVSFYMRSPNGVEVEYGWGARVIDPETWSVSEWIGGDVWGHRGIDQVSL